MCFNRVKETRSIRLVGADLWLRQGSTRHGNGTRSQTTTKMISVKHSNSTIMFGWGKLINSSLAVTSIRLTLSKCLRWRDRGMSPRSTSVREWPKGKIPYTQHQQSVQVYMQSLKQRKNAQARWGTRRLEYGAQAPRDLHTFIYKGARFFWFFYLK